MKSFEDDEELDDEDDQIGAEKLVTRSRTGKVEGAVARGQKARSQSRRVQKKADRDVKAEAAAFLAKRSGGAIA